MMGTRTQTTRVLQIAFLVFRKGEMKINFLISQPKHMIWTSGSGGDIL